MLDFHKELEDCRGDKSLILGNGFGIAYDAAAGTHSFRWDSLAELCNFDADSPLLLLLEQCYYDFELAHQKINNAINVSEHYAEGQQFSSVMSSEVQVLRSELISAITNSHPPSLGRRCTVEEKKIIAARVSRCRKFLKKFKRVFSLNYDLLLYWVRCYDNDFLGKDCFKSNGDILAFVEDENAEFFFPHGALFINRRGVDAEKSRSSTDVPILARVKQNIREGRFPMCVSEGTGEQKLAAIRDNNYLNFAYQRIEQSRGVIFTFGASFMEGKDDHIIEAMIKSPAKKIVVGEFEPTEADRLRLLHSFQSISEKIGRRKEIVVANTSRTEIW